MLLDFSFEISPYPERLKLKLIQKHFVVFRFNQRYQSLSTLLRVHHQTFGILLCVYFLNDVLVVLEVLAVLVIRIGVPPLGVALFVDVSPPVYDAVVESVDLLHRLHARLGLSLPCSHRTILRIVTVAGKTSTSRYNTVHFLDVLDDVQVNEVFFV